MYKEDLKYVNAGILGCSESELTEDLSQEVDSEGNPLTKEQVEFFKNSKVRDKQGRLLVCYHGSDADRFNVFDHSFISDDNKSGYGFYFTLGTKLKFNYISEYACYINLTNPLTDMKTIGEYVRDCEDLRSDGFTQKEIIDKLSKKYKCDGIINPERGVIAFYSNQIKSITNKTPSDSNNINEELLYHGQDDDDMYDRETTLTWYTTSEKYAKQYGQKIFTKDIDLSKYNLLDLGEINDEVFDNDGNYTKEFKQFCKKIEMTPKQLEKYLKQFGWHPKYLNFIFDITNEYPFYRLLLDLGYDGVKAKEGGYDTYGLIKSHLNESLDNKTFTFPNLKQAIDFFWKDRDAKIETIPIKKLVDDNDLLNDEDLQSYHQRQWDNKKASEFSIDKNKAKMWRVSEVPYAMRKKDGKLELGYGRHRTRALYNDGYKYVTLPVISESKLKESNANLQEDKSGIRVGDEITDTQAKTFYDRGYIDILVKNDKGESKLIPAWHSNETQKELSRELVKDKKTGKDSLKITGNKVDLPKFEQVVSDIKKELGDNIKFYTQSPKSNKAYPNEIENDVQDRVTGKAYKLFKVANGKLYPPVVSNTGAKETPTNVWIKCGSPEFVEVSASWGKPQVSQTSKGSLAFRAGWHLGELPYAPQFESRKNPGYLSSDKFVWAECEYDATINYQDRAMSYGFTKDGKFTNSAAGLPYRPIGGYYKYRTNPNPNTIAWVITGSMKVNKVLEDSEVEKICKENGVPYLKRPGGDKTLKELGLKESKTTPNIRESLLQEGKQDIENFKKWIENNEDSTARLMSAGNKEAFVNNWATEFNSVRQNLKSPYNDFYYWIKLNDWDAFTKFMQEQRNKKDAKQKEKDGARLIYSDKDWKVYEITTYEASVKYGANTKWCISGSKRWSNGANGRGYWDDYTSKGVKFYFFIGRDTKYAIAIYPNGTDFEIFDAQDNSIAYIPNAPIIDEIKVDYYSHNEDRLMLNLIKTGQLPHICVLLSIYLREHGWGTNVYDKRNFDNFLQEIRDNVNEDWVKWLAVYDGLKDEEWYKQETGEEYEDEWWGDITRYPQADLGFLDNYATLDDALTKDNPYFNYDSNEYFISDLESGDIDCCKDWVAVWLYIDDYIQDETDLLDFIKKEIRDNWGYSDFEKVGLSKEYLLGEKDLDESLDDFDDEVGKVYHGGIEKSLHKDFKSILWFTEDYDYALDFGENIFICNLNLKNTFIVGNTDGYIRGLIPTQFSTDFIRLANNLKVTPKELLKCNPEAKNIYSIVRTKAFKELCIKNGYDSVETEEFGHVCFGVFNLDQVDIVDTDFEDESTLETLSPMDESLKPRVREELLLEKGTDYKKQAVKIISNSGLFDEETSTKIIDGLFRQDIHAFNHAPAWLEKYLKGIARMLVQYCDGDKSKAQQFLTECPSEFEYYLTWVKQNREKIGNSLDDEFVNNLTYEQVKEKNNKIRDEMDAKSKDELSKMKFSNSSNYTLVPIDSYEQMHKLYGGPWTGDGTDEEGEYAGNGGTSWCHTNSKNTYDNWTKGGYRFFVLQRNNWKDISFNKKTTKEMRGKDDYGNSLIAILVNKYGKLDKATLRCNHVGISGSADNQYNSYSELSKIAGFNVEEEVLKYDFEEFSIDKLFTVENGVLIRASDNYEAYRDIVEYKIPTGVKTIAKNTFYNCINLESIEIPSSITSIGESAFESCISLASVTFEEGSQLTSIGDYTFSYCRSLTSITISNSVTSIGNGAFIWCRSLTSITFAEGSTLTSIGEFAFYNCSNLTSITIPASVTSIEDNAFYNRSPNLTVFTDNEYAKRYCNEYGIKCASLSEYNKS